jgi:hypothetical protein
MLDLHNWALLALALQLPATYHIPEALTTIIT